MALYSGSSGGKRRPLGPRPFSGRESSAHAPALRPRGVPRRATAAPFQAISEFLAPDASVSLATPTELPVTDAVEAQTVSRLSDPAETPLTCAVPVMAPSVLRVDDIRSEPLGWASGFSEAEPLTDREPAAAFDAPEALAEPVIEAVADAPELAAAVGGAVADAIDTERRAVAAESSTAEVTADADPETPSAFAADDSAWYDAASLEPAEVEASPPEDSPVDDWFANEVMHAASDPEASPWAGDDDVPVNSPWTDLVETDEAPTLETEAIEETQSLAPASEAIMPDDSPTGETVPDESWWPAPAEPVAHNAREPEVAIVSLPRRTPPVDGLAALEALVHETQGAERAVEALEAVARMIRSREIVVSVGAGATAESVLASILASLLSHPS